MVKLAGIAGLVVAAVVATGCDSFEDPNVVIDLRVLAMRAEPPTQLVDLDLTQPPDPAALAALLAQVQPTEVCALVADPGPARRLVWSMSLCPQVSGLRCDESTRIPLGGGVAEDPEDAMPAPALCVAVVPDDNLFSLLFAELSGDQLGGLGGIRYSVLLRIGGENDDPALDQYANKTLQISPRFPAEATANTNPRLDGLTASIEGVGDIPLLLGRCADSVFRTAVPAGARVRVTPREAVGTRERYVVPTLDGATQTFNESLTYQWIASTGGLSSGSTGGPRDFTGGLPPLFSDYLAPSSGELVDPDAPMDPPRAQDATLWIIQRDERLGVTWYESCLSIQP